MLKHTVTPPPTSRGGTALNRIGEIADGGELLAAVATLLEATACVREAAARNKEGQDVEILDETAVGFTAMGAMRFIAHYRNLDSGNTVGVAMHALAAQIRTDIADPATDTIDELEEFKDPRPTMRNLNLVLEWNDHSGQTKARVIATLRRAASGYTTASQPNHPK